jgi:hypothetical protein
MPREPIKVASRQDLEDKLAVILVSGTLYNSFAYTGSSLHITQTGGFQTARFATLPEQLRMFCSRCSAEQLWQIARMEGPIYFGHEGPPQQIAYYCRNCGQQQQYYWIEWLEVDGTDKDEDGGVFTKVGQWPPLSVEPSKQLARALGKENAGLYKKALINAAISHGLAGLAYFRRVIENKVNDLIDLVAEAAKNAESETQASKDIENVKGSLHLDDKIAFAKQLLPAHLRPGGHNPFDKLYGVASAGLHGESEERCLELFAEYKFAFEYLFQNLTVENEQAREFIKQMSKPSPKRGVQAVSSTQQEEPKS